MNLTGLTAGQDYCVQLTATNGSGTVQGGQIQFTAGRPQAFTDDAASTGATTAIVDGEVNPVGQTTTYQVQYGLASSDWCTSGGNTGTPGTTTTPQTLGFTDNNTHNVSVNLTGLTAGQSYCAQITATNASGTAQGGQQQFTAGRPQAFTGPVTSMGPTTATLNGEVNPVGQTTEYKVQYDLQSSPWCTSNGNSGTPSSATGPQTLGFTDNAPHMVSVNLTGLTAGQSYCAQLSATNASGTSQRGLARFTAGAPQASTDDVNSAGATTEVVDGEVNPVGQTTTYQVQYGLASSDWCTSGGNTGTPGTTTTPQTLGFTDNNTHSVSVNLTGLTAGRTTAPSSPPPTPPAPPRAARSSSPRASGRRNGRRAIHRRHHGYGQRRGQPGGQATSYAVQYDVQGSAWCTSRGNSGSPAFTTSPQPLGASDNSSHPVSANLTGLTAGQGYCAELTASNPSGTARGGQVFVTPGLPTAVTVDANATGPTTAVLDGSVNPAGQSTTYVVQYDLESSHWCQTDGGFGTPASTTSQQSVGSTDNTAHNVSVALSGLTPGQSYCAQLVATNAAGQSQGGLVQFAAGAPGVQTNDAQETGTTTATVTGTVNPANQSTTYQVQYGTAIRPGATPAVTRVPRGRRRRRSHSALPTPAHTTSRSP